jgi:hypothetical protein
MNRALDHSKQFLVNLYTSVSFDYAYEDMEIMHCLKLEQQ